MPRRNNHLETISFNPVTFEGAGFKPVVFEPKEPDLSILERSLARNEERQTKAVAEQNAVRQALGKVKSQMHQDAETEQYIIDLENQINDNIAGAASMGDWAGALNIAVDEAGKLTNNSEVIERIRTNNQYEEWDKTLKQRLQDGKIGQTKYQWALDENKYKFNPIKDENGTVIGSEGWSPTRRIVDDIDWTSASKLAFSMVTPKKESVSTQSSSSSYVNGTGSSGSSSRSEAFESVDVADIRESMKNVISGMPDGYERLAQDFEVRQYELKKLQERRDNATSEQERKNLDSQIQLIKNEIYVNGQPGNPNNESFLQDYYVKRVLENKPAELLAYNHKSISTASSSSRNVNAGGGGNGYKPVGKTYTGDVLYEGNDGALYTQTHNGNFVEVSGYDKGNLVSLDTEEIYSKSDDTKGLFQEPK